MIHKLEPIAKELDKAVNDVLRENFDLYFDEDEATEALKYWWTSRTSRRKDQFPQPLYGTDPTQPGRGGGND